MPKPAHTLFQGRNRGKWKGGKGKEEMQRGVGVNGDGETGGRKRRQVKGKRGEKRGEKKCREDNGKGTEM